MSHIFSLPYSYTDLDMGMWYFHCEVHYGKTGLSSHTHSNVITLLNFGMFVLFYMGVTHS